MVVVYLHGRRVLSATTQARPGFTVDLPVSAVRDGATAKVRSVTSVAAIYHGEENASGRTRSNCGGVQVCMADCRHQIIPRKAFALMEAMRLVTTKKMCAQPRPSLSCTQVSGTCWYRWHGGRRHA
jgi:hypothetical protein